MTEQIGLYVERFDDGTIHLVHIQDHNNLNTSIKPSEYIAAGYLPLIQFLPNKDECATNTESN